MDTAFTEEQDDVRRTVAELLARHCRPAGVRAASGTAAGYDEELWRQLAARTARAYGAGPAAAAAVFEEAGRVLLPSPLLPVTALSAPLVQQLGSEEQRARLLPELASGALTAALAVPGDALPHVLGLTAPAGPRQTGETWAGGGRAGGVQARSTEDGWRLYGEAGQVLSGHSAGLLLVAAHAGGYARSRVLLFLVRDGADGFARARQPVMDETRPAARVELRDTPAELLGADDAGAVASALARTGGLAAALLAAEAVGAAEGALAGVRSGRNRLDEVYGHIQSARSAAYNAARETGSAPPDAAVPPSGQLALAQALEVQRTAAGEAVHGQGGDGAPHWYFRRAAGDELLFGPAHRLRAHAAAPLTEVTQP